jgi:hypothetical protein
MARDVMDIMREGLAKETEARALLEKQMAGTITSDETARLAMLNGNLLALVKEAQAQGVGVVPDSEDEEFNIFNEDEDGDSSEVGSFRF